MWRKQPDKRFYSELADFNRDFLELIARYPGGESTRVLGLEPAVVAAIRRMDADQLGEVASAPCLLAGFGDPAPQEPVGIAEQPPQALSTACRAWRDAARVYAAGLITYLWQLSRNDALAATLCIGPLPPRIRHFAELSFSEIRQHTEGAVDYLQARLADHPHAWPDLVRFARSADAESQALSRLMLIPLGLAGCRPVVPGGRRRRYRSGGSLSPGVTR